MPFATNTYMSYERRLLLHKPILSFQILAVV